MHQICFLAYDSVLVRLLTSPHFQKVLEFVSINFFLLLKINSYLLHKLCFTAAMFLVLPFAIYHNQSISLSAHQNLPRFQ